MAPFSKSSVWSEMTFAILFLSCCALLVFRMLPRTTPQALAYSILTVNNAVIGDVTHITSLTIQADPADLVNSETLFKITFFGQPEMHYDLTEVYPSYTFHELVGNPITITLPLGWQVTQKSFVNNTAIITIAKPCPCSDKQDIPNTV